MIKWIVDTDHYGPPVYKGIRNNVLCFCIVKNMVSDGYWLRSYLTDYKKTIKVSDIDIAKDKADFLFKIWLDMMKLKSNTL